MPIGAKAMGMGLGLLASRRVHTVVCSSSPRIEQVVHMQLVRDIIIILKCKRKNKKSSACVCIEKINAEVDAENGAGKDANMM